MHSSAKTRLVRKNKGTEIDWKTLITLTACQLYAYHNYADVFPRFSRFWRHVQIVGNVAHWLKFLVKYT